MRVHEVIRHFIAFAEAAGPYWLFMTSFVAWYICKRFSKYIPKFFESYACGMTLGLGTVCLLLLAFNLADASPAFVHGVQARFIQINTWTKSRQGRYPKWVIGSLYVLLAAVGVIDRYYPRLAESRALGVARLDWLRSKIKQFQTSLSYTTTVVAMVAVFVFFAPPILERAIRSQIAHEYNAALHQRQDADQQLRTIKEALNPSPDRALMTIDESKRLRENVEKIESIRLDAFKRLFFDAVTGRQANDRVYQTGGDESAQQDVLSPSEMREEQELEQPIEDVRDLDSRRDRVARQNDAVKSRNASLKEALSTLAPLCWSEIQSSKRYEEVASTVKEYLQAIVKSRPDTAFIALGHDPSAKDAHSMLPDSSDADSSARSLAELIDRQRHRAGTNSGDPPIDPRLLAPSPGDSGRGLNELVRERISEGLDERRIK